jgi:hypothetical protein
MVKLINIAMHPTTFYRYFNVDVDAIDPADRHTSLYNTFYYTEEDEEEDEDEYDDFQAFGMDDADDDGVSFNRGTLFDTIGETNNLVVEFKLITKATDAQAERLLEQQINDMYKGQVQHPDMFIGKLTPNNVEIVAVYTMVDSPKKLRKALRKDSVDGHGYTVWSIHEMDETHFKRCRQLHDR